MPSPIRRPLDQGGKADRSPDRLLNFFEGAAEIQAQIIARGLVAGLNLARAVSRNR